MKRASAIRIAIGGGSGIRGLHEVSGDASKPTVPLCSLSRTSSGDGPPPHGGDGRRGEFCLHAGRRDPGVAFGVSEVAVWATGNRVPL
jgi:hypothetical protein